MALRILIVDDSATYRLIISRSLRAIDGVTVLGKAANGKQALFFLEHHDVDLITLDVQMPEMDGLETLKALKKKGFKKPILMLSGLSEQARELTIKCLQLGALDFVLKPDHTDVRENQKLLQSKLEMIIKDLPHSEVFGCVKPSLGTLTRSVRIPVQIHKQAMQPRSPKPSLIKRPKLLLIGISTGGPKALNEVLTHLTSSINFPIVIVQHMPPQFTKSLADNLNQKCELEIKEAEAGEALCPGHVYLAPGGYHMEINKTSKLNLILNKKPPVNSCRPSVDTLFFSASGLFNRGEIVALIMTGMGRDGADGCAQLINEGAFIAIQSEASCTVYGMPRSVAEEGNFHEVLELNEIAGFINKLARRL